MNKISKKYKKKFAIFLLTEFLLFTFLSLIHLHKYNFSNEFSFEQSSNSLLSSDLSNGLFSYCNLHQFSQSVLKYDNANIKKTKFTDFQLIVISENNKTHTLFINSKLIPRAPPFSI